MASDQGHSSANDSVDEHPGVSPELLAAVKIAVEEVVGSKLAKIDKALSDLVALNQRMAAVEAAMQATSDRLEDAITNMLPALTAHVSHLTEALARRQLELEVHRRKWNLVIHGLKGDAKEDGTVTRAKCLRFAQEVLQVPDAEDTPLAACHRLAQGADAGIILRFVDLADRDAWLSGTKHLKNYASKISISPDLPPVLRPLKDELMEKRSKLPTATKQKSRVRFLPKWPFVELRTEGQDPTRPSASLNSITAKMLDLQPLIELRESLEPQSNTLEPQS